MPNARTNSSAMRRARPQSSIAFAISIATITSQTDGFAKPPSTSGIGVPLTAIAVSPSSTSAEAGSGSVTMPAITQMKIAVCRQPCGVIVGGRRNDVGDDDVEDDERGEAASAGHGPGDCILLAAASPQATARQAAQCICCRCHRLGG